MSKAYKNTKLNSAYFSKDVFAMDDYFKSVQYFFTKDYIKSGFTLLDIGGASGNFASVINTNIAPINATIIDPDETSIKIGKKKNPDFTFIQGYFPDDINTYKKFDIVSIQALYPQISEWKKMLFSMRKLTKKYINIALAFKLNGTTVIDKDVSYFYYLDSGERVHQVIHNIYEFVNFLCIYEMGVKKIEFYGYHTPYTGHNFRCVPNSEQIKGNLMIEVFERDSDNPIRMGGAVNKGEDDSAYHFFVPEMKIIIDDAEFPLR